MQIESASFSTLAPNRAYPADRTVGSIILVIAAIGIPIMVFASIIMSAILSAASAAHLLHVFNYVNWHGSYHGDRGIMKIIHTVYHVVILSGLVYAGYAMSHSRKIGFIVAVVVSAAALLTHTAELLALATLIYAGLRLTGALGQKPE